MNQKIKHLAPEKNPLGIQDDAKLILHTVVNGDDVERYSDKLYRRKTGRMKYTKNLPKLFVKKIIISFTPRYQAIKALWADAGVQKVFAKRNEFQLNDSAA
jgi:hypothetical protein